MRLFSNSCNHARASHRRFPHANLTFRTSNRPMFELRIVRLLIGLGETEEDCFFLHFVRKDSINERRQDVYPLPRQSPGTENGPEKLFNVRWIGPRLRWQSVLWLSWHRPYRADGVRLLSVLWWFRQTLLRGRWEMEALCCPSAPVFRSTVFLRAALMRFVIHVVPFEYVSSSIASNPGGAHIASLATPRKQGSERIHKP